MEELVPIPSLGPGRVGHVSGHAGGGACTHLGDRGRRRQAQAVRRVDRGVVKIPPVLRVAGGLQTPAPSDTTAAQAPSSLRHSPLQCTHQLPLPHHILPGLWGNREPLQVLSRRAQAPAPSCPLRLLLAVRPPPPPPRVPVRPCSLAVSGPGTQDLLAIRALSRKASASQDM